MDGLVLESGLEYVQSPEALSTVNLRPGCDLSLWYAGRATHIHVKVYVNGSVVKTTQVAFPESTTAEVYASSVYASKGQSPTKNAADNVFADGTQTEMASVSGSPASGYEATLSVGISL